MRRDIAEAAPQRAPQRAPQPQPHLAAVSCQFAAGEHEHEHASSIKPPPQDPSLLRLSSAMYHTSPRSSSAAAAARVDVSVARSASPKRKRASLADNAVDKTVLLQVVRSYLQNAIMRKRMQQARHGDASPANYDSSNDKYADSVNAASVHELETALRAVDDEDWVQDLLQAHLPDYGFAQVIEELILHVQNKRKPSDACVDTTSSCCLLCDQEEQSHSSPLVFKSKAHCCQHGVRQR